MRVVYQCENFLPDVIGGVEVFSAHLLKALQARGHDVLVLTSRPGEQAAEKYSTFDGIDVCKLDFANVLRARDLTGYARMCARIDSMVSVFSSDVLVLADTARSGFFFLRARSAKTLPRLLTLHSPLRGPGRDTLQNRLMLEADKVVAISKSVFEDAVDAMPSVASKLVRITNALPASTVPASPLPFAPPRLLFVGRLSTEKAADTAIRATAFARDRGYHFDLEIAGDGPQRSQLQALTRSLNLDDRIHFSGWTAPQCIPALINMATVILVPSRWREPFGLVALQAMQMGRPVIASAVGGLPEIVEDGEAGLLVAPDDAPAMAHAILRLLGNPEITTRMGMAAALRARQKFDFSLLVDAYEAAIVDIVSTPHNAKTMA